MLKLSDGRANANRHNAKNSTGPRTAAGKTVSRLNATKHGIVSGLRVLPAVERQQDWDEHIERILSDLKPMGYLEFSLAERVALSLWRLGRVARYEREAASLRQETAEEELQELRRLTASPKDLLYTHPDEARTSAKLVKEKVVLLKGFPELADEAELTPDQATTLISSIESAAEVDIHADDFPSFPGIPDDLPLEDFTGWTAGLVREALRVIAVFATKDLEDLSTKDLEDPYTKDLEDLFTKALYRMALTEARAELAVADHRRKRIAIEIDRYRRQRLLPGPDDIDRVIRYEAHLERGLYRDLHELQRLQAGRAGVIAPPLAVDVEVIRDR